MSREIKMETERLILWMPSPEDAEAVLDFRVRNRKFLHPWLPSQTEEAFSLPAFTDFMKDEWADYAAGRSVHLVGALRDHPEVVMLDFRFSNIVRGAFQNCYLGYLQDEQHCGNGYMAEALMKGLWYMFAQENLHRVEANIMPRNTPSIRLVERLGFRKEGHSPRYLHINGVWEDHDRYALLNE